MPRDIPWHQARSYMGDVINLAEYESFKVGGEGDKIATHCQGANSLNRDLFAVYDIKALR